MAPNIIRERLNNIFQDVFDDPRLQLRDEMTAAHVEGWDSLSHIDLVVAIEKEFTIKLTTAEVRGLTNVGDLIRVISKKTTG